MFALLAAGRLPQTSFTQLDETHCIFELQSIASINHLCVFMDGSAPFPQGYAGTVHLLLPGGTGMGAGSSGSGSGSGNGSSGGQQGGWRLLGCLKNERPSAIYRLKGLASSSGSSSSFSNSNGSTGSSSATGSTLFTSQGLHANPGMFQASTAHGSATAMLGISVEPEHVVDEQMRGLKGGTVAGAAAMGGAGTGVQGMDIADEGMTGEGPAGQGAGALVRSGGAIDPYMALALAPKIAQNIFSYLSSFAPDSAPQTVPLLQKWLEQFERKLKMQGSAWLEKQGGEGG